MGIRVDHILTEQDIEISPQLVQLNKGGCQNVGILVYAPTTVFFLYNQFEKTWMCVNIDCRVGGC